MSGPDRIFAKSWKHATHSEVGVWSTTQHVGTAEYIRRDPGVLAALPEVQALIAGAFEAAANRMDDGWSYNAGNRIRALTPADAIAARDAVIADAVAKEREVCAHLGYVTCAETRHVKLGDAVSKAIRKRGDSK